MLNQKMYASRQYSCGAKLLSMLIGSLIYGAIICVDLPNKSWRQVSFALSFLCFVGAFMTGEAERFADEILTDDEDVASQAQLDATFENYRPKSSGRLKTVQMTSDHDFPTIPWG
jgi:hypothetical protein